MSIDIQLADLKAAFGKTVVSRGRLLALGGKVMRVSASHAGDSISGVVLDDDDRTQRPRIALERDGDAWRLSSQCTCDGKQGCEHAAAVVLEWLAGVRKSAEAAEDAQPQWLKWLSALPAEAVSARRHEVIFQLDLRASPRGAAPVLLAVEARRDDQGVLVEGHPIDVDPARPETLPPACSDFERRLLLLLGAHGGRKLGGGAVALSGADGAMVLSQVLQAGCLYWRNQLDQPLTQGPARVGRFEWRLRCDGAQVLAVSCGANYDVLPLLPMAYLDRTKGIVGIVESGLQPELLDRMFDAPVVAIDDVRDMVTAMREGAPRGVPRPWRPKEQSQLEHAPVGVIRFAGNLANRIADPFLRPAAQDSVHLELCYDYGGRRLPAVDQSGVFAWRDEQVLCVVERDHEAESGILAALRTVGLAEDELDPDLPLTERRSIWRPAGNDEAELAALLGAARQLKEQGFIVEVADDLDRVPLPAPRWAVGVAPGSGGYTLSLSLTVGDEQIPVLREISEWARSGEHTELFWLGRKKKPIVMRAEHLTPILDALPELGRRGAVSDDALALPMGAVGRLLELERALGAALERIEGGAQLQALARQLYADIDEAAEAFPSGIELRPYQQIGVRWLRRLDRLGFGGILADDMGLGKTVQTLAFLRMRRAAGESRPVLLVAPTSLVNNWQLEADRFAPELVKVVLRSGDRSKDYARVTDSDLVITTYALLLRDQEILADHAFGMAIFDEAQAIKNPQAKITRAARELSAERKFCLTGTPMENHLGELWSLTQVVAPGLLGPLREFQRGIQIPIENGDERAREMLADRLSPFLLRRTKDQVLRELPPKTTIVQSIEMHPEQRRLYERLRTSLAEDLTRRAEAGEFNHLNALDALLKLRQICCDPRLPKLDLDRDAAGSAKLVWLVDTVTQLVAENRRILVFSQFTRMLDLIRSELEAAGIEYRMLTGSTVDRAAPVEDFQAGRAPVFLMSLKAGGTGLNLTAADTVIHYDPWWNPAAEQQASDRAHRIGQESAVFIYKLIASNTVEERVLALQEHKSRLLEELPGAEGAEIAQLNVEELLKLVA